MGRKKLNYTVVLTQDRETKWFVAEVPELSGCISQGKNQAEALKNIKDAIQGYLESVKKHPLEERFKPIVEIKAVSV